VISVYSELDGGQWVSAVARTPPSHEEGAVIRVHLTASRRCYDSRVVGPGVAELRLSFITL